MVNVKRSKVQRVILTWTKVHRELAKSIYWLLRFWLKISWFRQFTLFGYIEKVIFAWNAFITCSRSNRGELKNAFILKMLKFECEISVAHLGMESVFFSIFWFCKSGKLHFFFTKIQNFPKINSRKITNMCRKKSLGILGQEHKKHFYDCNYTMILLIHN
jgi:hypothetical protein